jgi:hypothetical protein
LVSMVDPVLNRKSKPYASSWQWWWSILCANRDIESSGLGRYRQGTFILAFCRTWGALWLVPWVVSESFDFHIIHRFVSQLARWVYHPQLFVI